MKTFLYLILGIVQGITEPLPVSSSGHLVIAKALFGIETEGGAVFELVVHAGSLIAVLLFYKDDFIQLFKGFFTELPIYFKSKDLHEKKNLNHFHYGIKLIIATIPAGVIGLLFKDQITTLLSSPLSVGISLIITGTLLSIAHNKKTIKSERDEINYKNALIIGLSQMFALLPGISRSGTTNATGMVLGYDVKKSMKFAFFMFIPIATLAVLSGVKDLLTMPNIASEAFPLLIAFTASGVTTYFAMRLLFLILKERKLNYFAYYCFIVGTITTIVSIGSIIFR